MSNGKPRRFCYLKNAHKGGKNNKKSPLLCIKNFPRLSDMKNRKNRV